MSVLEYFLLFFSVILGGGAAFFLKESKQVRLPLILSFSGAFLLGITVLHLMPGVFTGNPEIGLWILVGFFIQLFLEQLSQGVEHGHIHAHKNADFSFALQIMVGLSLHAFIEGFPLSNYSEFHQLHHGHEHNNNHLIVGVILHKAPAAFVLVLLLLKSSFSKQLVLVLLIVFAAMSPTGALIADQMTLNMTWISRTVAIVIGSFLHISTTILFEADDTNQHKVSWSKLITISSGTALALLTLE